MNHSTHGTEGLQSALDWLCWFVDWLWVDWLIGWLIWLICWSRVKNQWKSGAKSIQNPPDGEPESNKLGPEFIKIGSKRPLGRILEASWGQFGPKTGPGDKKLPKQLQKSTSRPPWAHQVGGPKHKQNTCVFQVFWDIGLMLSKDPRLAPGSSK